MIIDNFSSTMEPISGADAIFLYGESPTSPMHISSLAVVEGSLKFETFRDVIASRLHLIPILRKRLIEVPMSIDYPYWVDDPHFSLNMHLQRIALPRPGGWRELRALVSNLIAQPLDKSRPLWSVTFIEGIDAIPQVPQGSVAIVSKMHHVAIDGMAGTDILSKLYDVSADVGEILEPPPYKPEPLPSELSMMAKSSLGFLSKPFKLPRLFVDSVSATVRAGVLTRMKGMALPTVPFTAPPTPLNGVISPERRWNSAILSLPRIKALKNAMGTTVNDVMLAICAGALRRYLSEIGKLPNKPLVALVPVSTRTAEQVGGNQLSAMLVQLATNIDDPLERLEAIHANTIRGKTYQGALGARTLSSMAEAVPFGIANQAVRFYSRFEMADRITPAINTLITNVPGPQIPLYVAGHKVLSIMGAAPLMDGLGLLIAILSYNGLVTINVTSNPSSMADVDKFTRYLRESANELEAHVLAYVESQKPAPDDALQAEVAKYFASVNQFLQDNPDSVADANGAFQFVITGNEAIEWLVDLNATPARVVAEKATSADATLTMRNDHFLRIASGDLDIPTALVQGRLQIKGDAAELMKLIEVLPA